MSILISTSPLCSFPTQSAWRDLPWNLFAKISVGLPVVGTGVKKALFISDPFPATSSAKVKPFTLPGRLSLLLPLRFKLFFLLSDCRFLRVPPREGANGCDWDMVELAWWVSLSPIVEDPEWPTMALSSRCTDWLCKFECEREWGAPSAKSVAPTCRWAILLWMLRRQHLPACKTFRGKAPQYCSRNMSRDPDCSLD